MSSTRMDCSLLCRPPRSSYRATFPKGLTPPFRPYLLILKVTMNRFCDEQIAHEVIMNNRYQIPEEDRYKEDQVCSLCPYIHCHSNPEYYMMMMMTGLLGLGGQ